MGSRPLPVAPLHLGSPWRSGAECFRASSLGFGMARCRRGPPRTGHRAHRVGLARRTRCLFLGSWPGRVTLVVPVVLLLIGLASAF